MSTAIGKAIKRNVIRKNLPHEGLALPTSRSRASVNLQDYTYQIYGEPKVGKTSLVSHFQDTLCGMFEPGAMALEIFQISIPDWPVFRGYVDLLVKKNHGFRNLSIDTGQVAYELCLISVCDQIGIEHPGGQDDYGQSWNRVKTAFQYEHNRILSAGLGLIIICHSKIEELVSLNGAQYNRIVPALGSQPGSFYKPLVDNLFYYHFIGTDRFLSVRGNDLIMAGTRCENNYLTPGGKPIFRVPMGNSSAEGYENLEKAFRNEQVDTHEKLVTREEADLEKQEVIIAKADALRKTRTTGVVRKKPLKRVKR